MSTPPPGGNQSKKRKDSTSGTSDAKQARLKITKIPKITQQPKAPATEELPNWALDDSRLTVPSSTTTTSSSDTTCNLCVNKGLKHRHLDDGKCSKFCRIEKSCRTCKGSPHLMHVGGEYAYYCAKCWPGSEKFNWLKCELCCKGIKKDGTPWCTAFYEHCTLCEREGYITERKQQSSNGQSQLLERDDGEWQCEPSCIGEEK